MQFVTRNIYSLTFVPPIGQETRRCQKFANVKFTHGGGNTEHRDVLNDSLNNSDFQFVLPSGKLTWLLKMAIEIDRNSGCPY